MLITRLLYPFLFLGLLLALPAHAETNVTGRFGDGKGDQVTVQLNVSAPPPAAFIVLLGLPSGVRLVEASPNPSGFNGQQVKWLFKHPGPGGASISMKLSKAVTKDQLQGQIRFSHPKTGKMFTRRIQ